MPASSTTAQPTVLDRRTRQASTRDADIVIAGAGCAGLSLLDRLIRDERRSHGRIVVIDRSIGIDDSITWSFWGDDTTPFSDLADNSWADIELRFPGSTIRQPIGTTRSTSGRRYHRVRSRDFTSRVLDAARSHPDVEFVEATIDGVSDRPGEDLADVRTSTGMIAASAVFQSVRRPEPPDDSALRQHFGGLEVVTENPVFMPHVATLMDFDVAQHDGTAFLYVLPDAPDRALVEFTMFSPSPRSRGFYDDHVHRHLEKLGAGQVSVERREYGVIPMDAARIDPTDGDRVWSIGTAGGMTKPSTGYTFQRIQRQVDHIASCLERGARPTAFDASSARYRFADRTLLQVLRDRPEIGREVFQRLFSSSTIDDVLTFLDESSTRRADASMIAGLPIRPFLKAALHQIRPRDRADAFAPSSAT